MRTISMLLAALAMIAFPGVAVGQGAGGSDEYSENIPGGGGNQPSDSGGSDGSSTTTPSSPSDGLSEGSDSGSSGSGSQGGSGGGDKGDGPNSGGFDLSESVAAPSEDGAGVGEVVGDLAGGSDDGMGLLLPIILGAALIAAAAFVLIRRNGDSPSDTA